jgi:hypothetical protein
MIMGIKIMFRAIFKAFFQTVIIVIGFLALSTASAKLPEKSFACHVSTTAAFDGLVMMQANDLKDAMKGALSTMAYTTNDSEAKTTSVIECINGRSADRFSDIQFQEFYEGLDGEFK